MEKKIAPMPSYGHGREKHGAMTVGIRPGGAIKDCSLTD
jgi:hypothetical protein